jgi:hypothetical protein
MTPRFKVGDKIRTPGGEVVHIIDIDLPKLDQTPCYTTDYENEEAKHLRFPVGGYYEQSAILICTERELIHDLLDYDS